jgi:hypothetical protein
MRFRYRTSDALGRIGDNLPRLPLTLRKGDRATEVVALVDSGSTVNVLPYQVGLQLGAVWERRSAILRLGGVLGGQAGVPLIAAAEIEGLPSVTLAFAWIQQDDVPVVLGQTNFFMEFDVCFYRSKLEFEVKAK